MRTFVLYSLLIFTSLASKTSLDRLQSATPIENRLHPITSKHYRPKSTKQLSNETWLNATQDSSSDHDRRRAPSNEVASLDSLKNTLVCGALMTAGAFIEDLKDDIKAEKQHINGQRIQEKDCSFLKDRFLKYLSNCDLSGGPTRTVYAGWTTDNAFLFGMSEAHGAYMSSNGEFGCFHEYCGSVGLQVAANVAFTVGVVFGDQAEFSGWSAGLQGGLDGLVAHVPIGAGLTFGGKPWVESGFSAGLNDGDSGFVCRTYINQDQLNAEKQQLLEEWAEVNRITGDTWRMGFCDQHGGKKVSLSKGGGELHKLTQCLTKCREVSNARACEYVTKSSTNKTPGCYYYTASVQRTDNKAEAMCYTNLHPSPCHSDVNWLDSDHDSCAVYENNLWCRDGRQHIGWNPEWGSISQYADSNGVTAYQACCACGRPATKALGACTNQPGWKDTSQDTCEDYRLGLWCQNDRHEGPGWHPQWGSIQDYASCEDYPFCASEVSAFVACCACGGGIRD